jgi:DNA polymerase III delta subunit
MPLLDPRALAKHIADRKLAPLYVFAGEDTRLIDRLVDDVEATVDEADRPFAVERVYAGEAGGSAVDIAAAARVFPMLGDRRIVIVLRAERILKPKRASKATEAVEATEDGPDEPIDLKPLEEYVASPNPTSTLVFVATDVDRTRRFTKLLVERAQVVVFGGLVADDFPGARQQARAAGIALVNEELRKNGRTIDGPAAELLVDRAAGEIDKLRGDLERLLLYTEGRTRITRDDVAEVAAAATEIEDEWAVVNAIADGNVGRALRQVALRLDRGDSVHALVGQLRWWVSTRLAPADPTRVKPALEALLRTDLALKSSGGDERGLVERLIVEITGRPVPRSMGWRG